jgi:aspartyl-tRNA(Asn)/glutamyl-tRNA(Gln) amidotransferase subunit B
MSSSDTATASGFETVVGLEVHVQLLTERKLFSPAFVRSGQDPNVDVDAVDVGLPGALPALNPDAVRAAIRLGLALDATIDTKSQFARKHYFYPDSPKGYQTSQADHPVIVGGAVTFVVDDKAGTEHTVQLVRAHLEEDAGKSIHDDGGTRVDYNRAGTALLEVVSTPTMNSGHEAMCFFRGLRQLVMALGICDGNLQEGSMRADANVSVRRPGEPLGTRVELKNINSPRFLADAVEHEAARQRAMIGRGERVVQETRLWDGEKQTSRAMRGKEDSPDYRYLPDPDLPPVHIADDVITAERLALPELPMARRRRLVALGLSPAQAGVIVDDTALAEAFDDAAALAVGAERAVANWLINEVTAIGGPGAIPAAALARVVMLVEGGDVAGKDGKALLRAIVDGEDGEDGAKRGAQTAADVDAIADRLGLRLQKGDDAIAAVKAIVADVFAANPKQVADVRAGKDKVKGFLVGMVLKSAGKGTDPKLAQRLVDEAIATTP